MGHAAAGVAIVAILALTVLALAAMARRRERVRQLRRERDQLAVTIAKVRNEVQTQLTAGYFDPEPIRVVLDDLKERELNS